MKRNANIVWKGTGKEGNSLVTTESKSLNEAHFNYKSRFEDGPGTNPEELLAAAHACCFTMKIAFLVNAKGFTADELATSCEVTMENGAISSSHLNIRGKIPGISNEDFQAVVKESKENCMVTKLYNLATTYEAVLEN